MNESMTAKSMPVMVGKKHKYIGVPVEDINYNQPASLPYKTENPFC